MRKSPRLHLRHITILTLLICCFLSGVAASAQTPLPDLEPNATPSSTVTVRETRDAKTDSTEQKTAESWFQTGIGAFKKSNLKLARHAFQESLKQDPLNVGTLYNLGLVEHRSGQIGRAMALWRKALAIHPGFTPAERSLVWAKEKLERSEIPHEVELWESLRNTVLIRFGLEAFVLTSGLLLLASGWLTLRFLGQRRQALLDEHPLPNFPLGALTSFLFLVASLGLTGAKTLDLSETRATILAKKIEARSTPDIAGTPLFELYEGLEVILRQTRGEWAQVSYPGGSTGWIPRKSVFSTIDPVTGGDEATK